MKRKYLPEKITFLMIFFCFITASQSVFCQKLYWENGISFSSIEITDTEQSYQTAIGINYMDHPYWFLSSEAGYIRKGGILKLTEVENTILNKEYRGNAYLSFNTLINLKKEINNIDFYIGIGPRIDFKVKEEGKNISRESQDFLWGLTGTAGINSYYKNILYGIKFSWLPSFSKIYQESPLKDKTFKAGVIIGYVF